MAFSWVRTIHFGDTDAAGVVYFARYLEFCHEAYEEALAHAGIELAKFFADTGTIIPVGEGGDQLSAPASHRRQGQHRPDAARPGAGHV